MGRWNCPAYGVNETFLGICTHCGAYTSESLSETLKGFAKELKKIKNKEKKNQVEPGKPV